MRDDKIGILAANERLDLFFSADPVNPTGARGITFVTSNCVFSEIIPGRAGMLDLTWSTDRRLRLLNVYGPNDRQESITFWRTLTQKNLRSVSVMLGDFNIVDMPIDRLPQKDDPEPNPTTKMYTYIQSATGSQSRIDRIYVSRTVEKDVDDWCSTTTGVPTDHKMVSVMVANKQAPYVGKGRWSLPTHLLTDDTLKTEMKRLGSRLLSELEQLEERTPLSNPQACYRRFKSDLISAARKRAKTKIPKMDKQIVQLRENLHVGGDRPGAPGGTGAEALRPEALECCSQALDAR
ncbi:hypothetical protein OH77DRAFT_1499698 [Trametes cingulata]|nr:hypothetical protein OH77DRAFT_1499698 [Trametes cingulata]